jgi:hypothetical protein
MPNFNSQNLIYCKILLIYVYLILSPFAGERKKGVCGILCIGCLGQ